MMTMETAMALALIAPPMLYVGCRIVFSAYFAAKHTYQRKLLEELSGGDNGTT